MNDNVRIICENDGSSLFVPMGTTLDQIVEMLALKNDYPFLAAYVNNRLKEMNYRVYNPVSVRFIDITHFAGMGVYQRTLFFVLQKAVYDLYPDRKLYIKNSVAKGFYCEIQGLEDVPGEALDQIQERMRDLVDQDIPIVREKMTLARL